MSDFFNKWGKFLIGIVSFIIIIIVFLLIFKGCSSSKGKHENYEDDMISAAKKYFSNKNLLPVNEGGEVSVSLSDLVNGEYIKSAEKKIEDKSCDGSVIVKNNGGHYLYIPNLICDEYKTVHLIDKLLENVVEEKSGLYKVDDGYVFKGKKVKNYVSFFGKKYLIISIDNDNILKLIKVDAEKEKVVWDSKFNSSVKRTYGKNDYSDSFVIEKLNELYTNAKDEQKKHMVAYSVCYGSRSLKYVTIDKTSECSQRLDNQFISLPNVYDFVMSSYDSECNSIYSGSCVNYNYLYSSIDNTWLINGVADNTYEVYYYYGRIDKAKASMAKKYNIIIYLSGNELYIDGDGSSKNPYVIK